MKRALLFGAVLALAVGIGPRVATAQSDPGEMTCAWAGDIYQPGETVTIAGEPMVCDGTTGTWVKAEDGN